MTIEYNSIHLEVHYHFGFMLSNQTIVESGQPSFV